jgi:twinkle protein
MSDHILHYVREKHWRYKEVHGGLEMACPFEDCEDHNDKGHHFFIYFNNEVFKCFKCGQSGHILRLKRLFGDLEYIKQESGGGKIFEITLAEKKHQALLADKEAMEYLTKTRGFNKKAIGLWKLGLDTRCDRQGQEQKCIVFPYLKAGVLCNLKYKSLYKYPGNDGGKPRYITTQEVGASHILFGLDLVSAEDKYVIVCEGEYDAIAATMYGLKNVVSVPNGAKGWGSWVEGLDRFEKVYLMYDNDKDGEEGAEELARRLGKYRCYRVRLPLKDLNECLMAGLAAKELQECINKAYHYVDEETVELSKIIDKVDTLYQQSTAAKGFPTGWDQFDMTLGGYRMGEVTVITGDTTSGKTTFGCNLLYKCLQQDQGILIYSAEIPAAKIMAKLMSIHYKADFYSKETFTPDMYVKAKEWFLDKNIFFIDAHGSIPFYKLTDAIELTTKFHNVRMVLLDPMNFLLDNDIDEFKAIKQFNEELSKLTKKTGVHTILTVHPKQMDDPELLRKKGMHFMRGGSCIKQTADNVAILWRNKEEEIKGIHHVELKWDKVRDDTGKEGVCHFYFDPVSQRYDEQIKKEQKKIRAAKVVREVTLNDDGSVAS